MRNRALLLYGDEERFKMQMEKFATYLETKTGSEVELLCVYDDPAKALGRLAEICRETPSSVPLLIAYDGHGILAGWGTMDGGTLSYDDISNAMKLRDGPLLFINETCYGAWYLERLRRFRDAADTCFIAPMGGFGTNHGGVLHDAIVYWDARMTWEEFSWSYAFYDDDGKLTLACQVRWGAPLEENFFPSA